MFFTAGTFHMYHNNAAAIATWSTGDIARTAMVVAASARASSAQGTTVPPVNDSFARALTRRAATVRAANPNICVGREKKMKRFKDYFLRDSNMTSIYIVEWAIADVDGQFEIRAFGKTSDEKSVVLRIAFYPYFFVATKGWTPSRQRLFLCECIKDYNANERYSLPVIRKDAWGYSAGAEKYVQLAFDTLKDQKIARARLAKTMDTYEGAVDPVVRLCHVRKIAPTGWVAATGFKGVDDRIFPGADLELRGEFTGISPCDDTEKGPPPLVLCSWDIEVYSSTGAFPTPDIQENAVIQIASAFQRLGSDDVHRKVVVCLDETAAVDGAEIISVATEKDLYTEWLRVLAEEKVDVFMGWNTWQFDWKYIAGRVAVLTDDTGVSEVDLSGLGRGPDGAGELRTWELNSGAYGQNSYSLLRAPGILDLDLMQLVKREHKLESYALNNVANAFLGESKLDLPASEIFRKFKGTAEDRADIARYAVQDVLLPLKLFDKLALYDNLAQMSIATCVPMDYLLSRGQQIKVFSLILKQAKDMGYVLPDNKKYTIEGRFEGATVLAPKRGAYFDVISGLDFASLYPSIIRSYNMCYSTLVLPGSPAPKDVYEIDTGLGTYRFVQDSPGIVPKLLENLAVWRKNAKTKMAECKAAGDTFGTKVWNGSQLAYKVSMNSVYGFLGASHGYLPCVPIAASVTATGRQMIEKTKVMAMELVPGSDVVYGDTDSVMVCFKVAEDKRYDVGEHFRVAQHVAREISKTFPGCIELEFEKCYYPYLLFSKKRYAGLMFTNPDKHDCIDVKGLQLVRRDNAPIVKHVSQHILEAIMYDKSTEKAVEAARHSVLSVITGKEPMAHFVVSKSLRGSYANPNAQPHVQVARKIRERTGESLPSGSRVPYVFVVDNNIDGLISSRAEDPDFAERERLEIDYLYYVEHQLLSPVAALLELLVEDPAEEVLGCKNIKDILEHMRTARKALVRDVKRVKTNAKNRQYEITRFFNK